MGTLLDPVMCCCRDNKLPPLTIIVVNNETGEPGPGLTDINQLNVERDTAFQYNLYGLIPPTPKESEEIHRKSQKKADSPAHH